MLSKHSGKTGKWFPKRSLRRRILWFLSCLVVFCTTYALILPAITLANETYCHLDEHQHDENCFRSPEPLCNQESPENGTAPPHEHDDSCYDENQNLTCNKQEQTPVHQHTDECYRSDKPLCGKEEHTHSKMCYSNQEDVEKKEDWEKTLPKNLDGTTRENLISVAESQIGYKENETNFILDSDENAKNYSRYGEWYGKPYEDWNLMFLSFLLHYSEISDIPYGYDWKEWREDLKEEEIDVQNPEDLKPGDIVLFHLSPEKEKELSKEGKAADNYIGVISSKDPERVITGNWNGKVTELEIKKEKLVIDGTFPYSEETSEDNESKPDKPDSEKEPEPLPTPEPDEPDQEDSDSENEDKTKIPDVALDEIYQFENEDFYFEVKPILKKLEETDKPDDMDKDLQPETLKTANDTATIGQSKESEEQIDEIGLFNLENTDSPEAENEEFSDTKVTGTKIVISEVPSEMDSSDESLVDEKKFRFQFIQNEEEVNTKAYTFEVSVVPKETYLSTVIEKAYEDEATEINEIVLSVLDADSSHEEKTSVKAEDEQPVDSSTVQYALNQEPEAVVLDSTGNVFEINALRVPNPSFQVQTYGYLEKISQCSSDQKPRILAYNQDGSPNTKPIYYPLKKDGSSNNYLLDREQNVLEKIYSTKTYKYHSAPNIYYFNQLIDNESFTLETLWVLKDGKKADSTNQDDWTIYSDPMNKLYTNNEETYKKDTNKYVLVQQNTVLRLVYKPIQTTYKSGTQFFDYDITDGKEYVSSDGIKGYATAANAVTATKSVQGTDKSVTLGVGLGINSPQNYSKTTGALYSFGNQNTGVPFSYINSMINDGIGNRWINLGSNVKGSKWGDENRNYPVFNMVTGITTDRLPIFNENISAPDLFSGDGSVEGKTIVDGGSLEFIRKGDTYTLTEAFINNTSVSSNLDKFSHPGSHDNIWTNHFWPVDSIQGKDPKTDPDPAKTKFGYLDKNEKFHHFGTYPPSDNGDKHNNLFGMKFEVEFELDGTYEGPLDYFFFGDDDLWVFIDDTLVADIGGVKQSKGVHVDLRKKMPSLNGSVGKHRLTVFYTERGLSGSTCYMEFTLPSVSGVEDSEKTGGFKLAKRTYDDDKQTEFEFDIRLLDATGNPLGNDYAYLKYKEGDSNPMDHPDEDWLIMPSYSRVSLRKDEYLIVKYLPLGSRFEIKEVLSGDVQTEVKFDPHSDVADDPPDQFTGTITGSNSFQAVTCFNKRFYKLPETGGFGINRLMISGGVLIVISSAVLIGQRWKRRRYK